MEFEAVDEGIVTKLIVAEGTDSVLVNSAIALITDENSEDAIDKKAPNIKAQTDTNLNKTEVKNQVKPLEENETRMGHCGSNQNSNCERSNSRCNG